MAVRTIPERQYTNKKVDTSGNAAARRLEVSTAFSSSIRTRGFLVFCATLGNLFVKFGGSTVDATTSSFDAFIPIGARLPILLPATATHVSICTDGDDFDAYVQEVD